MKASGADIFFFAGVPKQGVQAIKKSAELGWKATRILNNSAVAFGTPKNAGLENSKGIISMEFHKDVLDPKLKDDPGVKEYNAFLDKYMPREDRTSDSPMVGYMESVILVHILEQCGDDLTRENVMRQAANLKNFEMGLLLDGMKLNTSPTDFYLIEQFQMKRFGEGNW